MSFSPAGIFATGGCIGVILCSVDACACIVKLLMHMPRHGGAACCTSNGTSPISLGHLHSCVYHHAL